MVLAKGRAVSDPTLALLDAMQADSDAETALLNDLVDRSIQECGLDSVKIERGEKVAYVVNRDALLYFLRCARFFEAEMKDERAIVQRKSSSGLSP